MRDFNSLSEREILALAISLEEEDERIYADFAEGLRQDFPASASIFDGMREEESGHRRRLIELYPTAAAAHYHYALVLLDQHDPEAALGQMVRDDPEYVQAGLPLILDALGRRSDADRELATAERTWGNGMAYQISYVYTARNERDRALDWLERAYKQHDSGLAYIKLDPMLTTLEREPRYNALLQKLKLPQ